MYYSSGIHKLGIVPCWCCRLSGTHQLHFNRGKCIPVRWISYVTCVRIREHHILASGVLVSSRLLGLAPPPPAASILQFHSSTLVAGITITTTVKWIDSDSCQVPFGCLKSNRKQSTQQSLHGQQTAQCCGRIPTSPATINTGFNRFSRRVLLLGGRRAFLHLQYGNT